MSEYRDLLNYFETKKDTYWKKWLEYDNVFTKGKQGIVGLFKTTQGKKFVFKISRYVNYLVQHEFIVMKSLLSISPFCPHFCKPVGILSCGMNPKIKKEGNPFEVEEKNLINRDVMLLEYINGYKFYDFIEDKKIQEKVIFSIIKQVIVALAIAQKHNRFSHYDLHSDNIMIKSCKKNSVFLYNLGNDQVAIPTHGSFPVIIDFGFSYVKEMDNDWLWPSMGHTNVGFTSDRFDWVTDPKLFLVTVSSEIKNNKKTSNSKTFRRIVHNIFDKLPINFNSGWEDENRPSASDSVIKILKKHFEPSILFSKYDCHCFDLIQSLIILPLQKQDYSNINVEFKAFFNEFIKIETAVGNSLLSLCVLKEIVDSAREYRDDYSDLDTRDKAVEAFKNTVYSAIDQLIKFCFPKNVRFEVLFCAVLCLAKSLEGVMFDHMKKYMIEKNNNYNELPVSSIEEILGILMYNIQDSFEYDENTTIYIFDSVAKRNWTTQIKAVDLENINETASISQGPLLWSLYKS